MDLSNVCAKSYFLYYFSNIDCCSVLYKFNRVNDRSCTVCTLTAEKCMVIKPLFWNFQEKFANMQLHDIFKIKAKKITNTFEYAPRYYTVSCNIPKQLVEPFLRTKSFSKIKKMSEVVAGVLPMDTDSICILWYYTL